MLLGVFLCAVWLVYQSRGALRRWMVETLAQARLEGHLRVERELDSRLRKRSEELRVAEGRPEREPLTFTETPNPWSTK